MRRTLLTLVALLVVAAIAVSIALRNPNVIAYYAERQARLHFANSLANSDLFDDKALRVILCGTSSPLPDPDRAKACTVVIAGGRAYVVDTGPESWKTLALLRFPPERIAGVMLTHFHSDHIGDLGEFRLQTWVSGRRQPLSVYGPPGVDKVTAGFNLAYALDDGYRAADHGPEVAPIAAAPLLAKPFQVGMSEAHDQAEIILDDNGLRVTAIEVSHDPARPAVGYRFDYKARSVVISGDTIKSANLAVRSKGADVLVHEAQSQRFRQIIADAARGAGNDSAAKILDDIENYHSSPVDAAEIANAAGVKLLVYSHFIPPLTSWIIEPLFFENVAITRPDDGWVIGFDGLRLDLPVGSDAIVRSTLPIRGLR